MNKKILLLVILLVFVPFVTFADGVPTTKMSLEQKGEFQSIIKVAPNDFQVPTMIDVPIVFDDDARELVIVTDSADATLSSTIVNMVQKSELNLRASDSFGKMDSNNMIDGRNETFTEFPFVENGGRYEITDSDVVLRDLGTEGTEIMYSEEHYIGGEESAEVKNQNVVTIDVQSDRQFHADSMSFDFGKNIERPTRIRVASVRSDGSEQILLPEKFFGNDVVNFPEANANHYRITLHYIKLLRINEINFHEKSVPQMTKNYVRFIAQPKIAYDIYYNAENYVKTEQIESPNFATDKKVQVVEFESVENNPLYKKADADEDGIVDSADNCVNVVNVDQIDKDKNGIGDACEDFDRDGIVNANDNCPTVANRAQIDEDADGIGNKCDGEESRFMEKYPWIPYVVLAVVFFVVAVLIVRTLKHK